MEELRRDISESIKGSTTSLFISNMIENKQGWQSRLTQVVLPTMVSTSGVPDLQFEASPLLHLQSLRHSVASSLTINPVSHLAHLYVDIKPVHPLGSGTPFGH